MSSKEQPKNQQAKHATAGAQSTEESWTELNSPHQGAMSGRIPGFYQPIEFETKYGEKHIGHLATVPNSPSFGGRCPRPTITSNRGIFIADAVDQNEVIYYSPLQVVRWRPSSPIARVRLIGEQIEEDLQFGGIISPLFLIYVYMRGREISPNQRLAYIDNTRKYEGADGKIYWETRLGSNFGMSVVMTEYQESDNGKVRLQFSATAMSPEKEMEFSYKQVRDAAELIIRHLSPL